MYKVYYSYITNPDKIHNKTLTKQEFENLAHYDELTSRNIRIIAFIGIPKEGKNEPGK